MVFFTEEIEKFNRAYFHNMCAALDTETGMHHFCRDTFLRTKGIVPELDKDALDCITLDLKHRYMFDTKYKVSRWGFVQIPEALIEEYAAQILDKVVLRRGPQAEEEAQRQVARKAREEEARKAREEAARKAGEEASRLAEELWNEEARLQEEVARKCHQI